MSIAHAKQAITYLRRLEHISAEEKRKLAGTLENLLDTIDGLKKAPAPEVEHLGERGSEPASEDDLAVKIKAAFGG